MPEVIGSILYALFELLIEAICEFFSEWVVEKFLGAVRLSICAVWSALGFALQWLALRLHS